MRTYVRICIYLHTQNLQKEEIDGIYIEPAEGRKEREADKFNSHQSFERRS